MRYYRVVLGVLFIIALTLFSASAVRGFTFELQSMMLLTDPSTHIVQIGSWTGVGYIDLEPDATGNLASIRGCGATLLPTGHHVLTAAHCIPDEDELAEVIFPLANPKEVVAVKRSFPHPDASIDLAVLELVRPARSDIERYELYRDADEIGQIFFKIGYGLAGDGRRGDRYASLPNKALWIRNRYDGLASIFLKPNITLPAHLVDKKRAAIREFDPAVYLVYDFDDGTPEHDAFGIHFGIHDTGLGEDEGMTSGGDSGSPAFIGKRIVGITSDGFSDYRLFPDKEVADISVVEAQSLEELRRKVGDEVFDEMVEFFRTLNLEPSLERLQNVFSDDASVGEFGLDVRVSRVANFIDQVINGG